MLFRGNSFEADMAAARGCWRHLRTMFQELEECRAFELLKVLPFLFGSAQYILYSSTRINTHTYT